MNSLSLMIETQSELTMSSREIAELCEKRHSDVLRDINKILDELDLSRRNFASAYFDAQNKERKEYQLPKDLTLTLVSGYRVALRHKIIQRWLELENKPVTPAEMMLAQCQQLVAHERRLKEVETRQDKVETKLARFDHQTGYQTVAAFGTVEKIQMPLSKANAIGRIATRICQKEGHEIDRVACSRFGQVNAPPIDVLHRAHEEYGCCC